MSDLLVCTQAFTATVNGRVVSVQQGEIAHSGAAIVRGRRNFFKPLEVRHGAAVEEATAEPGRRRRATFSKSTSETEAKGRYTGLKQPALKAELDKRSIEYPSGPVRNATLIELLEEDDG